MSRNMKDSGIEWIGEIPENWRVIKYKGLLKKSLDDAGVGKPTQNKIIGYFN